VIIRADADDRGQPVGTTGLDESTLAPFFYGRPLLCLSGRCSPRSVSVNGDAAAFAARAASRSEPQRVAKVALITMMAVVLQQGPLRGPRVRPRDPWPPLACSRAVASPAGGLVVMGRPMGWPWSW